MSTEDDIFEIEAVGYSAIQAGDAALLRTLLAPSFSATTADGKSVTREEWIATVTAAAKHGISLRPHAPTITVSENLAIVHREVTVESATGPQAHTQRISYVTVYEYRDGRWYIALNSSRPV